MKRLSCLALGILLAGCGQTERLVGNGSETTTGIAARILDSAGAPVVGAMVEARPAGWTASILDPHDPVRQARTDADGMVRFSALPSGTWNIVSAVAGNKAMKRAQATISPDGNPLELRLDRTVRLSGRIDTADGSPLWVGIAGLPDAARPDASGAFLFDSVPAGEIVLKYASSGNRRGATSVSTSPGTSVNAGTLVARRALQDGTRTDSVAIEFDAGAGRADTLLGYPLLVRLSDASFDFSRTDGTDLQFSRGVKILPHQVEHWDPSSRTAVVWLKIDTLLPSDRKMSILLRYGGFDLPDWSDGPSVFDPLDGWRAVWHLDATDPGLDATGRHRATDWRTADAPGSIGRGRYCDTGWLRAPDSADLRLQTLTISAWAKREGPQISTGKLVSKGNLDDWHNTWSLQYFDASWRQGFLSLHGDAASDTLRSSAAMPDGTWSLVAATWDAATGRQILYLDGKPVDSSIQLAGIDYLNRPPANMDLFIGANFIGVVDEVRISSTVRPPSWIALDQLTQRPGSPALRLRKLP